MKINKKGFTFIEIIVSLSIVSIVCFIATTIMFSTIKSFNVVTKMNEDKLFVDNVFRLVSNKLEFATNVEIIDKNSSDTPKYKNIFKLTDNKLYFNDEDMYGELLGSNKGIVLDVNASKNAINMSITLKDKDDNTVYKDNMTFKINTIAAKGISIEGEIEKDITDPIISYDDGGRFQFDIKTIPNTLSEQMNEMPRFNDTLSSIEKEQLKEELGGWWASNDNFRKYLLKKVYGGTWPTVQNYFNGEYPPLPYDTQPWYIQPYINIFKVKPGEEGYGDVTVYVNTTSGNTGWTSVYMIYDYNEQRWYYTQDKRKNIAIMDRPYSLIKQDIIDKGWIVYEPKQ